MADRTRTVVLIGAGRMGKLIAEALPASGFELLGTYDVTSATELDVAAPAAELAIDFSNKASLPHTLAYARRTGAALLSGMEVTIWVVAPVATLVGTALAAGWAFSPK